MCMRQRGMSALEACLAVALLGAFLGVSLAYHRQALMRARELVLEADLRNLRASVTFLEAMRHRLPATLEELRTQPIGRVRIEPGSATWGPFRDLGHALVDPFGNPYRYDATTGRVSSATREYETR